MYPGVLYTSSCALTAVTAQVDLIEIVAPSAGVLIPWELSLCQSTEVGDAQEKQLFLEWLRGYTTSGSGGATVRTNPDNPNITAGSTATVEMLNTTLASTTTPTAHGKYQWNVRAGLYIPFPPPGPWVLRNSERMVLRTNAAPADSITIAVAFKYWLL